MILWVTTMKTIKSYSELMEIDNFIERFRYLKLDGVVGEETFGSHRWLNQILYQSPEWKEFRRDILIRDGCCDLGCEGFEIGTRATVHHINPITIEDVMNRRPAVFDPENVITVCDSTHKAIHYGDENLLYPGPVERTKNDTCPWRQ